ncbi:hypothetical protein GAYE_SCF13G3503 [Galdieria yellowstonensis]|uniref:Reverse transcriptase zinc-binding domain-containing protein n=1 Tax=Galdieria yellowstonensis TaxID=3028027 RepID=A0AAV9IDV4_9RHOD|nr:hypothetical protein GAYE_SCF13G3503 [Galdieria yellowstonensis]
MKTRCPYCLANVPGTLSHLLWECTRWASKRLVIFGSMAKLFAKLLAILGFIHIAFSVKRKPWLKLFIYVGRIGSTVDLRSAGTGLGYKDLFWQVGFQRPNYKGSYLQIDDYSKMRKGLSEDLLVHH